MAKLSHMTWEEKMKFDAKNMILERILTKIVENQRQNTINCKNNNN